MFTRILIANCGEIALRVIRTAARGFIDDVIEPSETRGLLIRSLEVLKTKHEERPVRKHGNIPL